MKRIVFMGVPAFGHTNPTFLVIQKLVERGHQVRYYTVSNFRNSLEKLGAEVICYDDTIQYLTVEHVNQPTHNQKNHFLLLTDLSMRFLLKVIILGIIHCMVYIET